MLGIPIIASDSDDAIQKISIGEHLVDLFEIRTDLMDSFDLKKIFGATSKKILVTYRSEAEGGKGVNDPGARAEHVIEAMNEGADMVDVELSLPDEWRRKIFTANQGSEIVISTHFPNRTPSSQFLVKIFNESVDTNAHIVKIVTWADQWEDNLRTLELIPMALERGVKIISFCMGPMGRISRVMSLLMGAHIGFTSLEQGQESASGQIVVNDMKKMLEYFGP